MLIMYFQHYLATKSASYTGFLQILKKEKLKRKKKNVSSLSPWAILYQAISPFLPLATNDMSKIK